MVAVVVVERFKQESMYGLFAGTKKVAVVERWPLVKVRLFWLCQEDNIVKEEIFLTLTVMLV